MKFVRLNIFNFPVALNIEIEKVGSEQYYNLKMLTLEIYRLLIEQIIVITQNSNLFEKYLKLGDSKKSGFEEFCMQFSLGLISFFKNNNKFSINNSFEFCY